MYFQECLTLTNVILNYLLKSPFLLLLFSEYYENSTLHWNYKTENRGFIAARKGIKSKQGGGGRKMKSGGRIRGSSQWPSRVPHVPFPPPFSKIFSKVGFVFLAPPCPVPPSTFVVGLVYWPAQCKPVTPASTLPICCAGQARPSACQLVRLTSCLGLSCFCLGFCLGLIAWFGFSEQGAWLFKIIILIVFYL